MMVNLKSFLRRLRPKGQHVAASTSYSPHIPASIDEDKLIADIADFFHFEHTYVNEEMHKYRSFSKRSSYAEQLSERKTLCLEEAFIIYLILKSGRPRTIVEIGTDYGRSTRRMIDIKNLLKMNSKIICFDVVDRVKHFSQDEAQLILKDVTNSFRQDVLEAFTPGMIYLDARPYNLLKNVISEVLDYPGDLILAIHDCGRGLCNPNMAQNKEDTNITSAKGVWERHVLAEIMKVANPLDERLDNFQTSTHYLRIFGTPHGLAVILLKSKSNLK